MSQLRYEARKVTAGARDMKKAGYMKARGSLGWKPVLLCVSQAMSAYLVCLHFIFLRFLHLLLQNEGLQ